LGFGERGDAEMKTGLNKMNTSAEVSFLQVLSLIRPVKKGLILTALGSFLTAPFAEAQLTCERVFESQRKELAEFVNPDGYDQWLLWEQTANFEPFRKPITSIRLPMTKVKPRDVQIEFSEDAPEFLKKFFVRESGKLILWFKHPYNKSTEVPYHDKETDNSIPVYLTASRSIAFGGQTLRGFTIKLPTDLPHGPYGQRQTGKAHSEDDILSAIVRSNHIRKVDREIGVDETLIVTTESMTIAEWKSGNGAVVRDVRVLNDGYYYVPALSIPYIGRKIADINKQSFRGFWSENFAALLGRAKAKLLLRYGIQLETPNSQNMLVQLDRNLRPTGRIVIRDVSDSFFVDSVARGLGFEEQLKKDIDITYKPHETLIPFWSNSSWRFDEAGKDSVDAETLQQWGIAHNKAYLEELETALGTPLVWDPVGKGMKVPDQAPDLYASLMTESVQERLKEYRQKLMQQQKDALEGRGTQSKLGLISKSKPTAAKK
jgi:hypothetical protein